MEQQNQKKQRQMQKQPTGEQSSPQPTAQAQQPQQSDPKDAKIAELTNDLKRLAAEFDNYKKRVEKENGEFRAFAKVDLIKKLLPVLDSMEIGLKNTQNHDTFVKGMELVYSQLYGLLEEEGIEQIQTQNRRFDPYFHEALMMEDDAGDEGRILEEFQKGYLVKGKIVRHSKVKVSKKPT
ncbi:nucleotide exchange factor GrpE [Candidatus Woesearchaeota archaeon]|nr:nucleotide exchange factor GrpE [Candidatus Woesearchaeota archaeon]